MTQTQQQQQHMMLEEWTHRVIGFSLYFEYIY